MNRASEYFDSNVYLSKILNDVQRHLLIMCVPCRYWGYRYFGMGYRNYGFKRVGCRYQNCHTTANRKHLKYDDIDIAAVVVHHDLTGGIVVGYVKQKDV